MRRLSSFGILSVFLLVFASCAMYDPTQLGAVKVEDKGDYLTILPTSASVQPVALLFLPGGFVDAAAYVTPLSRVAAQGFAVVIPREPLGLAVIDPTKGTRLIQQSGSTLAPGASRWVIGGHSLGGAMAATAYNQSPATYAGIVFCAAYPAESDDLSKKTVPVLSLSASRDGLATPEKINATKRLNPPGTIYYVIEGGNHAQFGHYGRQNGDNDAILSSNAQWTQIAAQITSFLSNR